MSGKRNVAYFMMQRLFFKGKRHTCIYCMKRLNIFYFSGTGNSKQIALWLAEYALSRSVDSNVSDISNVERIESFDKDDTIVIISPIHGFNYPAITRKFIRNLPNGSNDVVLMCTRAGMKYKNHVTPGLTGVAFFVSDVALNRKGYDVIGEIPFDMPSNWFFIHPSLCKSTVDFLFERNREKAMEQFRILFDKGQNFLSHRDVIQDILISPISLGYFLVGRYMFAKSFIASSECIRCKSCINKCPVHAIRQVDGKPFWTLKCESCMKCMVECKQQAIEAAHGFIIAATVISSIIFSALTGLFLFRFIESGLLSFLVESAFFILFLCIFYRLQHYMFRFGFFERAIKYLSLTYYRFWGKRNGSRLC